VFPPPPLRDPPPPKTGPRWRDHVRAWAGRSPLHFATVVTAGVFAVASFLPIWQAVYFGSWEINGYQATFWEALAALAYAMTREPVGTVASLQAWNAALLGGLLVVSLVVGRSVGRGMNSFEAMNLVCLGLLVAAAVAGAVYVGWPWWVVAPVALFGGRWMIERNAPGTR